MKINWADGQRVPRLVACLFAFVALMLCGTPVLADDPNDDLQQIQNQAETLQAQADACAKMKCPVCDCAELARLMQALVDAETILDSLHNALIEADGAMRLNYYNAYANSHLTGVKLAQLQTSLAWEEYFHKIGSYLLKIASIGNTLEGISNGTFQINGDKGALDVLDRLDSLGNLLKNTGDLTTDLATGLATGGVPPTGAAKQMIDLGADMKSEAVDLAKVARDARKAYKDSGAAGVADALKNSRNLLSAIGRGLKLYSGSKLNAEKALLKDLSANEGPEAAALTQAFQDWQRVNARKFAAEDALAAVRQAEEALSACRARGNCGSMTLSRPALPTSASYGEALRAIDRLLPSVLANLKGTVATKDKCPETGTPAQPPSPTPTSTTPLPSPKHVVENNCPACAGLALELARTEDQLDFVGEELHRIRQNIEKADELEKDAELLRQSIKRITDLIREFREGKTDRNALLRAGDALFRALGKADIEINIESLEREKVLEQAKLHTLEEQIAALRAEQDKVIPLTKEQIRLGNLTVELKAKLAECQRNCAPTTVAPPFNACTMYQKLFEQWDERARKFPNDSNRNQRDAYKRKLCDCLKEHPELATPELKKLCPEAASKTSSVGAVPTPAKTGKIGNGLIGLVLPSDAGPNDTVCARVVNNPRAWKDSPLVRVVEFQVQLPLDDSGKPILARTSISFDGGPRQPADGPVTCKIPGSGTTNVSIAIVDGPGPGVEKPVSCRGNASEGGEVSAQPQAPQVWMKGSIVALRGQFTGEPTSTSVTVSDKPVYLVTGTSRGWNLVLAGDTPPGGATVVVADSGRRMSARVTVMTLELSVTHPNLLRGESTDFAARVLGLDGVPESAWATPYAPDQLARSLAAAAAPGLPLPERRPGSILLVLENRSREVISMGGEKDGRIIVFIDRGSVKDGGFEFKGKASAIQRGGFNIHCTVIPLMTPVTFTPEPK